MRLAGTIPNSHAERRLARRFSPAQIFRSPQILLCSLRSAGIQVASSVLTTAVAELKATVRGSSERRGVGQRANCLHVRAVFASDRVAGLSCCNLRLVMCSWPQRPGGAHRNTVLLSAALPQKRAAPPPPPRPVSLRLVLFLCVCAVVVVEVVKETKRPDLSGRPHCKGVAIGVARRGARRSGEISMQPVRSKWLELLEVPAFLNVNPKNNHAIGV